jgi:hypothetical protein
MLNIILTRGWYPPEFVITYNVPHLWCVNKGTISWDFFYSGFFIKQLLLVQPDTPRKDFEFFRIFEELFCVHNQLPVYSSPGSRLRISIPPRRFEKIRYRSWACLLGPGEVVWWKKPETRNLVTLFLFVVFTSISASDLRTSLSAIRDRLNNIFYRIPPDIYCNSGRMWEWEDFSGRKTVNIFLL